MHTFRHGVLEEPDRNGTRGEEVFLQCSMCSSSQRETLTDGVLMVFSWCSHGALMVFSWSSHAVLMVLSLCSHGVLMVLSWCSHGTLCVSPHRERPCSDSWRPTNWTWTPPWRSSVFSRRRRTRTTRCTFPSPLSPPHVILN